VTAVTTIILPYLASGIEFEEHWTTPLTTVLHPH